MAIINTQVNFPPRSILYSIRNHIPKRKYFSVGSRILKILIFSPYVSSDFRIMSKTKIDHVEERTLRALVYSVAPIQLKL